MRDSFYHDIIKMSSMGFAYHRIVLDEHNEPSDYIFLEVNGAFENYTGLKGCDITGKRITEVIPDITKDNFNWIKTYGEIAINGGVYEFDQFSESLNRWYHIKAISPDKNHFVTYFTDITAEKAQKLRAERKFKEYFKDAPLSVYIFDKQGQLFDVNESASLTTGYSEKELTGMNVIELFTSLGYKKAEQTLSTLIKNGHVAVEMGFITSAHKKKHVEITATRLSGDLEDRYIAFSQDITEKKRALDDLKKEKEMLKITLKSIGDGVVVTDHDGKITIINDVMEKLSGWKQEECFGQIFTDIVKLENERTKEPCTNPVQIVLDTGNIVGLANHTVIIRKDGTKRPIADSAAPIKDAEGNILGVVMVIRDVTEERKKREAVAYLGYHDSLTGLYNRRFFDEELLRLDKERNLPLSIIIGDVNGLKLTNDAFGHTIGDKLLKKMSDTIKKACRSDDIIARWGGDEFIILLPKTSAKEADEICKRIRILTSRIKIEEINFSISLGYETKRFPGEDINNVLKIAEDYMYRKKTIESQSTRGNSIHTILMTLHEKNPREERHSSRVREISKNIAYALNLTDKEVNDIEIIALMHDIGKIALDEQILNKNGTLDEKEWFEIKRHPDIGFRILSASTEMAYIANCVLAHHEKYNGQGYPNGLEKDCIPLLARIISLADAYDAMTSDRPYRNAMAKKDALDEIRRNSGEQFDPDIVEAFMGIAAYL